MDRIIPTKYAAAALRTALRAEFPGVKFSVRSGAASISVGWTDGPGTPAVQKITDAFKGSDWDGFNSTYVPTGRRLTVTIDGEEVTGSPLVNHLTLRRAFSPEVTAEAEALWSAAFDGADPKGGGMHGSVRIEGQWIEDTYAANQVLLIAQDVVAPRHWKAAQNTPAPARAARKPRTAPAPVAEAEAAVPKQRKERKERKPRPTGHTITVTYLPEVGLTVTGTRMRDGASPVLRDFGFTWDRDRRAWTVHTPDDSMAPGVVAVLREAGLTATLGQPTTPAADAYATADHIGTRSHQCDATAVHTAPNGARAYVLLDGIDSSEAISEWTRTEADLLARTAADHADAAAGLRARYEEHATDPDRQDPYERRHMPAAAAVVVVTAPGQPLTVAWCGDSRAYLLTRGITRRLTEDHNMRRVLPPAAGRHGGSRNRITSYLGAVNTDEECTAAYGHPAIESLTLRLDGPARLLLASDGAYEPHEDARHDLYTELDDDPLTTTATAFVDLAVKTSLLTSIALDPARPHADNATVLLADLTVS